MGILEVVMQKRLPKPRVKVISSISKRFSPRVFAPDEPTKEDLEIIFEAARHAPSGRNHEPWYFYLLRKGSENYERLFTYIPERNYWAKTSPIIIVACYDPSEPVDGINRWAIYDLGASVMSLILQAQDLGYYCRQIGIFDWEKSKLLLKIKKPYEPFTLIAIGKIGREDDYQKADPETVQKELTAKQLKNTIFEEIA